MRTKKQKPNLLIHTKPYWEPTLQVRSSSSPWCSLHLLHRFGLRIWTGSSLPRWRYKIFINWVLVFSVVKQLQNVGRSYDGLSVSAKGAGPSCGVVLTVLVLLRCWPCWPSWLQWSFFSHARWVNFVCHRKRGPKNKNSICQSILNLTEKLLSKCDLHPPLGVRCICSTVLIFGSAAKFSLPRWRYKILIIRVLVFFSCKTTPERQS